MWSDGQNIDFEISEIDVFGGYAILVSPSPNTTSG